MASDGFGDDLSRIFELPEDLSIEALLASADMLGNEPPPQTVLPAAAPGQHPVPPPVAPIDPPVQPVDHPILAGLPPPASPVQVNDDQSIPPGVSSPLNIDDIDLDNLDILFEADDFKFSDNDNEDYLNFMKDDDDSSSSSNSSDSADDDSSQTLPPVPPAAETTPVFVSVSKDVQLQYCNECQIVREVRHANGPLQQYLAVHRDANARFVHAIVARMYNAGADWPKNRIEWLRLDLSRQTHAWVLRFMERSMETMRNAGGTVNVTMHGGGDGGEGGSSSSAGAGSSAHTQEAGIDMLCELFATWATTIAAEAPAPAAAPAPAPAAAQVVPSADKPVVVDSAKDGAAANPTEYPSSVTRRQQRRAVDDVTKEQEEEARRFLLVLKTNAEREIGRELPNAIKRICNKNRDNRSIARRIISNNKKLRRLWGRAHKRFGRDLLEVKDSGVEFVNENKRLYEALVREAKRWQRENGGGRRCTPAPRSRDDGPGPSGGTGGGSGGGAGGAAGSCAAVS